MTQQELERYRTKVPMGIQAIMGEEPETEQDKYGFYSTGTFQWKGKFIIIPKTMANGT